MLPTGLSLSRSLFFSQGLPHYQRRGRATLRHCDYTRWQRGEQLLPFTYIIGDIYIHFWSFQIRHHQTCYTVSLSLNCHFLCKCYLAKLVKYLKQGTGRDAHKQTHTHTHIHACAVSHTLREALWHSSSPRAGQSMNVEKCIFFLFYGLILHTPSPKCRSKIQDLRL